MNNNCKHLKQGFGKLKCTKLKKEITWSDCKNCDYKTYKEYKPLKATTPLKAKKPIKKVSKKQIKLEKDRFSIIVKDVKHCFYHKNRKAHPHEIYCGRNRRNSIIYGMCIGLCEECHTKYQNDALFNDYWHVRGQKKFIEYYPTIKFENVFKINYL